MTSEKQFYVYVHRKATDGTVFYVGKGGNDKFKRAHNKSSRSTFWKRIEAKYKRTVEIVFLSSNEICAFSLERALIKFYGRENLCNLTDGGEGTSGRLASLNQRLKCSISNKGTKPSFSTMNAAIAKNSKPVGTMCGLRFDSAAHAARDLLPHVGFSSAKCSISASCNGRGVSNAFGYEFRFIVDGKLKDSTFKPKKVGVSVRTKCGLKFESAQEACNWLKENGYPRAQNGNIIANCMGKVRSAYGYNWSYA